MFSEFYSKSSSFHLSLDYSSNLDESKILIHNQDLSHDVWNHMFDHLQLTGHAPSYPGCWCVLFLLPGAWFLALFNLLNMTCHWAWKPFTPSTLLTPQLYSHVCMCPPTHPIQDQGSFPLLVFTYSWQRFWMRKRETLHSLQLLHELWKKRIVHCGQKGIWNK